MIPRGATWTSERVEQLTSCFKAGLSCSQIAREIGVTRNAVIGKMNRLGLSRPKEMIANLPPRPRALKAVRTKAWRAGIWDRSIGAVHDQILISGRCGTQLAAEAIPAGNGCSLLELGQGKCRWPINDPGAENFCFCGNAPVEGLPYCLGHARIAYRPGGRQRGARP